MSRSIVAAKTTSSLAAHVELTGGSLEVRLPDDGELVATITGGFVHFPDSLQTDLGCGPGVSLVFVEIDIEDTGETGTIEGCLDDLHGLSSCIQYSTGRRHHDPGLFAAAFRRRPRRCAAAPASGKQPQREPDPRRGGPEQHVRVRRRRGR